MKLWQKTLIPKSLFTNAKVLLLEMPAYFIRSFDVPLANRKKKDSPLHQELEKVVFRSPDSKLNFFNYRMRAINYPEDYHVRPVVHLESMELYAKAAWPAAKRGKRILPVGRETVYLQQCVKY